MATTPATVQSRWSVATLFFINGVVLASWFPHIPAIKARHALSDGQLGVVLLSMAAGSVLALPLAGWLIGRIGSRIATSTAAIGLCLVLPLRYSPGPRAGRLMLPGAALEKIADGFGWVEGPVWNRRGGYLLFSDIPSNSIFKWQPGVGVSRFLRPSGYTGAAPFEGREPGSNGLTFDAAGRLVLCEHGDRRIARLEPDGRKTTLADRYEGKRLNSPNDLVFKSNGDLILHGSALRPAQDLRGSPQGAALQWRVPPRRRRPTDAAHPGLEGAQRNRLLARRKNALPDAVRVLQGHSFGFAVQRTGRVVRQGQDLLVRQAELAADGSIDVLSELAAVQGRHPAVEQSLQLAIDQPRGVDPRPHRP